MFTSIACASLIELLIALFVMVCSICTGLTTDFLQVLADHTASECRNSKRAELDLHVEQSSVLVSRSMRSLRETTSVHVEEYVCACS